MFCINQGTERRAGGPCQIRLCHQLGRATPAAAEGQGPLIRPLGTYVGKSLKTTYTGGTVRNSSTTTTASGNHHFATLTTAHKSDDTYLSQL